MWIWICSQTSFDELELSSYLVTQYGFELDFMARSTLKGKIEGVQIDCIARQYPWIAPYQEEEDIRLAAPSDIAAMKLNAIVGNGTRIKDFIDIAYLSTLLSLEDMLESYKLKYKANIIMPLKALTYWEDINFDEPIKMLNLSSFKWRNIERRLLEMQRYPNRKFTSIG